MYAVASVCPTTYEFTQRSLKMKSFPGGKKVHWTAVKSWQIGQSRRGNALLLQFRLTWFRSETIVFHGSYKKSDIERLVRAYGRI
jgi:hypothetical protein